MKIEFVGQLKNTDGTHVCFNDSRKNKKNRTKSFSRKFNSLIKDSEL